MVWSDDACEVWVIELTICFETNYEEASTRKTNRYTDLMEQISGSNFDGELVTLEVGSRGFLSLPSFDTLQKQLLQCSKHQ